MTEVNLPRDFADPLAVSEIAPKAWVVRDQDGSISAFYARSTEHGYPLRWEPESQHFVDGALGSQWDRTGRYVFGPDPRDLDRFPVAVANGEVIIELQLMRGASHE